MSTTRIESTQTHRTYALEQIMLGDDDQTIEDIYSIELELEDDLDGPTLTLRPYNGRALFRFENSSIETVEAIANLMLEAVKLAKQWQEEDQQTTKERKP